MKFSAVLSVDWSRGSQTLNYIIARNRVGPVGKVLGDFIDFLYDNNALRFKELTVAGFSLGGVVVTHECLKTI